MFPVREEKREIPLSVSDIIQEVVLFLPGSAAFLSPLKNLFLILIIIMKKISL